LGSPSVASRIALGKAQQLALEVNFMKLCGEAVALGLTPSKAMGFVDFGGGARFGIAYVEWIIFFWGRS